MAEIWRIARKELWSFFASPVAYIFLGTYLAVSLFVFFLGGDFFRPQYCRYPASI